MDELTALAVATIRDIADHSDYRAMGDDRFWLALTVHLPHFLKELTSANGL